jgi:CRISPR system Cascade subunit CasE
MYLSRLRFHTANREARHSLQTPYHLHAAVMTAFPKPENLPDTPKHIHLPDARVLFRREQDQRFSPWVEVLVQSMKAPNWSELAQNLGQAFMFEQKAFSVAFSREQNLSFRLRANPVVTRDKKRLPIIGEIEQRTWLERQGKKHGFELADCSLFDEGKWEAHKEDENGQKHSIAISTVFYEGRLIVDDPELFGNAVATGIGPAKAFGCGLLSVARFR